jgi:mitochondrial cardiolipin hydrolase
MKIIFLLASIISSMHLNSAPRLPKNSVSVAFNNQEFGKTHFIVGFPHQENGAQQKCAPSKQGLAQMLQCDDGSFKQAFFSPDDNLQEILIGLIDHEKSSIRIAIFSFTNGAIAQALVNAHRRGVQVEIVTDISSMYDRFGKIRWLKEQGIKVYVYNPFNKAILNNIMHHKFVLFANNIEGKALLWTGSANWTRSAKENNQENVIVLDESHLIARYAHQFNLLKDRTSQKEAYNNGQNQKRFTTTIPS